MADALDWIGAGLDFYGSTQANKKSQQAIEDSYKLQNPWNQYQPAFGSGLMALLSNPGMITQTPGYQFAYDQGLQGLFAKQASTGNRFSGRALTESMQFGQGLASQMYNSEADRYANLAGANQGNQGGTAMGQDLSSLYQQQSFNQGYFLNNLFDNVSTGSNKNNTSVTNAYDSSYGNNTGGYGDDWR